VAEIVIDASPVDLEVATDVVGQPGDLIRDR
jgi:hypothetical protein